jgi:hypothetical protein
MSPLEGQSANDHENTDYIVMKYKIERCSPWILKIGQFPFGTTANFALLELSKTHLMLLIIYTNTICKLQKG